MNKQDAYNLFHAGSKVFSKIENNGMRIDTDYVKQAIDDTEKEISLLEQEIRDSDEGKKWIKKYGNKTTFYSDKQLAYVLFKILKYEPVMFTASGAAATSAEALEQINSEFVDKIFKLKKLNKACNTYLKNFLSESVDGILRPFFNLHLVKSYRSSSDNPNFQNIPVRDPLIKELIRKSFKAREGRRIVEIDYSALEVRIAACYHKDPNMISYIQDKTKDMHRDMAMECFRLDQVTKEVRYVAKNMFVFPQFYGSYYASCAPNMWAAIDKLKLTTVDGKPLKEHLEEQEIYRLGKEVEPKTFLSHIKHVEDDFWGNRFPVYNQWKKDWYAEYQKKGYFNSLTGFTYSGYMRRNEVINLAVQGSAFHCTLWALINLQDTLERREMKTLIIGQIHDSIVADVPDCELYSYLKIAQNIMTKRLCKAWKWIKVPLEIEAEITPVNGTWFEKKEIKI